MLTILFVVVGIDLALALATAAAALIRHRSTARRWRSRRAARSILDADPIRIAPAVGSLRDWPVMRLLARSISRRRRTEGPVRRVHLEAALRARLFDAIDRGHARAPVRALRCFADVPLDDLHPRLVELLHSGDDRLLVETLAAIGAHPAACANALVLVAQVMRERSARARFVGAWTCLRILRVRPDLLAVFQTDASAEIRAVVVRAAAAFDPIVANALHDPDDAVRRAAAGRLPRLGSDPAMVRKLVASIDDPLADVREAAAAAIGRAPRALDELALAQLIDRSDVPTRQALLTALSASGQAPDAALQWAEDRHSPNRPAAIRLLAASRQPRAQDTLARLLDDRDRRVQAESAAAAAWLARAIYPAPLDRVLVDRLLALLRRGHGSTIEPAIDALAHSGDDRVPPALLARIPDSSAATAERLVDAAALFGHLQRWRGSPAAAGA